MYLVIGHTIEVSTSYFITLIDHVFENNLKDRMWLENFFHGHILGFGNKL